MRRRANQLIMLGFTVSFALTVMECVSQALKVNGAAGVFHTIV